MTRWRVTGGLTGPLPSLTLSVDGDDEETAQAVEEAAAESGVELERIEYLEP